MKPGALKRYAWRAPMAKSGVRVQLLPKGSVSLATSQTGATLYMEPKPAAELNNAAARLAATEERETLRVLADLTRRVQVHAQQLATSLEAAVDIDLAVARAGHAKCAVLPSALSPSSTIWVHAS